MCSRWVRTVYWVMFSRRSCADRFR
jgi:hypothetical protein